MADRKSVEKRIRLIREALDMTQSQLAKQLNISPATMCHIEKGLYRPNFEFLVNISKKFNVNLYYVLFGEGDMFLDPFIWYMNQSDGYAVNPGEVRRFLWFFQRSQIVQYLTLGYFKTIMKRERQSIEQEINEFDNNQMD
ncbi:MAG: helix-turn-helix transcriptional regulator [Candidatus Aminicenantes bacterium]|nr:MAG: helix-turn-helix transcriptional regulator [Candidatus Aminicenantes bacterium]